MSVQGDTQTISIPLDYGVYVDATAATSNGVLLMSYNAARLANNNSNKQESYVPLLLELIGIRAGRQMNHAGVLAKGGQIQVEDLWTTEAFVDELFLCLAGVKEYVTNKENSKQVTVRKYYHQARNLMKWIPIAKPSPPFVIYISDLTPNVKDRLDELARTYKDTLTYILKQSVGRIFENLDFDYYHLSIARNLKVGLEKK
jgi:hypothetical protein